ncbi:MAG: CCA tRNA nucleotidyltransferase [Eubacterium sp.]|nr:CCA tRNA nucleotidyltransferase [Eubacterium sp.]
MQISIPQDVLWILRKLNQAGHEAYVVGGCVRDSLMGREPHDWDITTDAVPLAVKALFRRTIDTGLQHGTVTVMNHGVGYEVTTYRLDGDYSDHRRPESVSFTKNLEEDLKRRDFTINAMAYHPEEGLKDFFGGKEDLAAAVIRAVGDPDERFDEDALRIMRAVRFAAQLGFTIEEKTREAIRRHTKDISLVSVERIETELTKLICSPHPEEMEELYALGITAEILPEFDRMMETPQNTKYHFTDVGHHTIVVMQNVSPTKTMRYAALLHDIAKPDCKTTDEKGTDHFYGHPVKGEPMAEEILRRFRMDNRTIEDVKRLVLWHDHGIKDEMTPVRFRKGMNRMGIEYFQEFLELRLADIAGQSDYLREEKLEKTEQLKRLYQEQLDSAAPLTLKDLAVKGKDLQEAGVAPGPEMGRILKALLELVLENPDLNEKEILLEKVREQNEGAVKR